MNRIKPYRKVFSRMEKDAEFMARLIAKHLWMPDWARRYTEVVLDEFAERNFGMQRRIVEDIEL